ncbi:hypothetical protein BKK80_10880 [Cupriavidus malaysiensis]|uniref:Uncharacterized protein n=2 Tax=Cupriavidus malaysiensis TaxID=367825 RepID=A0A1D9I2G4_9BURK|nr:hypothetical protein BKK80_10880 [Cupriavidus malaysiensis]
MSNGPFLIVGTWLVVDNNLTGKASSNDALVVACLKGLVAGVGNTDLALLLGAIGIGVWLHLRERHEHRRNEYDLT